MANENIQMYPTRQRITLNDKATKILFNLNDGQYTKAVNGQSRKLVEKKSHKKKGKLKSGYSIQNEEGYTNIAPLDEYERAIFDVCISEQANGNPCITFAQIQRALSGKVADNAEIHKDQRAAILQGVDKLICTLYDPDILEVYEELNYEGAEKIVKAPILPAKRTKKIINGQKTDVIYFYDESPLLKIAKAKGQILTYEAELLDVPDQNNTRLVVMLKNYTLRRVLEIKQHSKQLKPILTFEDIFQKCRITDAAKSTKFNARATLDKFFAHLQAKGEIKSYEFTKKGLTFHSIKFKY